jgi:hypothetical protein
MHLLASPFLLYGVLKGKMNACHSWTGSKQVRTMDIRRDVIERHKPRLSLLFFFFGYCNPFIVQRESQWRKKGEVCSSSPSSSNVCPFLVRNVTYGNPLSEFRSASNRTTGGSRKSDLLNASKFCILGRMYRREHGTLELHQVIRLPYELSDGHV